VVTFTFSKPIGSCGYRGLLCGLNVRMASGQRCYARCAIASYSILELGGLHFSHPCARHTLTGQGAHRTNSEADGVLHDPSLSNVFRLAILQ
jgi:hypothetical protein